MGDVSATTSDELASLVGKVADEYTDRLNRGEPVSIDEYAERYPQIADILRQVLPSLGLVRQVGPFSRPGHFGTNPTPLPEYLGDYRIEREVGRGGMGVVYEADQKSLGRRVALKVLPYHRLMDGVYLKRFEREAQAAARLHHTNIVPVFGAGEHDGIHFYAMQYIAGLGLDQVIRALRTQPAATNGAREQILDDAERGIVARLAGLPFAEYVRTVARFGVQVADALAHAHSQGILHRDVKPSNLMLDAAGTVWITDFGLAKADSSEDLTHTGDVVGTLRYTAPERLAGQTDVRSDVFGLGLTLYELVTLRPAYDAETQASLLQQVTAADPPPPRRLEPRIPADLNTIIEKAIARQSDRRYRTPAELASDLQRFLDDRPIAARQTSPLDHAWRWCRRNPALAGLSTGAFAVLLVGSGIIFWQWRLTDYQRRIAEANFKTARDAVDDCFSTVTNDPAFQEPGMEPARQVLFKTALKYYRDFSNQRSAEPGVQTDLARAYYRLGYITERIAAKPEALSAYEQSRFLFAQLAASQPSNPAPRAELAQCDEALSVLHQDMGQFAQAEIELLSARSLREQLASEEPANPERRHELAQTLRLLGGLNRVTARPKPAEAFYRRAFELREALVATNPARAEYRNALARDYSDLARLLAATSRPAEAEAALTKATSALELLVRDHPESAEYRDSLATAYNFLGSLLLNSNGPPLSIASAYDKALGLREQLARNHPRVNEYKSELARVRNNLALWHYLAGEYDKAADQYAQALALRVELAHAHPSAVAYQKAVAKTHHDLGLLFRRQGRSDDAEREFHDALTVMESLAKVHPEVSDYAVEVASAANNLGILVRALGRNRQSLDWHARAIASASSVLQSEPQHTEARRLLTQAYSGRARGLTAIGGYDEALTDWTRALEYGTEVVAPAAKAGRAATLAYTGKYPEALHEIDGLTPRAGGGMPFLSECARVYAIAATVCATDTTLSPDEQRARAGRYTHTALDLLIRGASAGEFSTKSSVASLQHDRDFQSLHHLPEFVALLADVQKRTSQ